MAAEQRTGRMCNNGCGRSIEHLRIDSKWCAWCKVLKEKERKNRNRRAQTARVSSVTHRRHLVVNLSGSLAERPRSQGPCGICCGMPWARVTNRYTEGRYDERPVAYVPPYTGEVVPPAVCRGCGDPYADLPPVEREPCIRSSAGTTIRAAAMYAVSYEPGKGRPEKNGSK